MFTERSEPIMLITCCYMYLCFPVSWALWFCHILLLFGKSPVSIISFDVLYDSFTRARPLLSFLVLSAFYADPLHNQPSLESAMPRAGARDITRMQY